MWVYCWRRGLVAPGLEKDVLKKEEANEEKGDYEK